MKEVARDLKDLGISFRTQQIKCERHDSSIKEKWSNQVDDNTKSNDRLGDLEDDMATLSRSVGLAKMKWGIVQFISQVAGTIAGGVVVGLVVYFVTRGPK